MRICLLLLASLALAQPIQEAFPGGYVDWTRGVLVVSSSGSQSAGAPKALQVTEQEALNRLQAQVQDEQRLVRLDSDQKVGDRMQAGDPVAGLLLESSGNFIISEARYYSSGRVELTAELPLHGWLRPALVDAAAGKAGQELATEYTGVLIDARGLSLRPSVAPKIKDPQGLVLYGLSSLTPQTAGERMPVRWVGDPADPEAIERAGERPLILSASSAARGGDIVLDEEQAARLVQVTRGTSLLLQARVVVVADP